MIWPALSQRILGSVTLDRAANVVIIVAGIAICVTLFLPGPTRDRRDRKPSYARDDVFKPIPGLKGDPGRATLALFFSPSCRYCAENMPFYRRLTETIEANRLPVRFVLVTSSSSQATQDYLAREKLERLPVFAGHLDAKVPGTPSLVLVDATGHVRDAWYGFLNEKNQATVLTRLRE